MRELDDLEVAPRPVREPDLEALFRQMRDPASVWMAAFTADDSDDRARFEGHMAKVLASPDATMRVVTRGGEVVGSIGSFVSDGHTEITYWADGAWWGRGVASRAVALLLEEVPVRPLFARAPSDNVASLRVLGKAGSSWCRPRSRSRRAAGPRSRS